MTNSERKRDSSVIMSSVMPSEKYSCSWSPDILVKGSTAMEGGVSLTTATVGAATNVEAEIRNMPCTTLGQTCILAPVGTATARGCVCWNRLATGNMAGQRWACGSINNWSALAP